MIINHRDIHLDTMIVRDGMEENRINRGQRHHFITNFTKRAHARRHRRDHTGRKNRPIQRKIHLMAAHHKIMESHFPSFIWLRIPKNRVSNPILQCFLQARGYRKIHICHPHRQFIRTAIPFDAAAMSTIYHLVKIIGVNHVR